MTGWDVSPKEAVRIQEELRRRVRLESFKGRPRTVAGADVSLDLYSTTVYAGVIVLSYPEFEPVDSAVVRAEVRFPYISGLLSFREAPALLECFKRLKVKPDITLVDGQGVAHPRRLGLASHLGLLLDRPTIGVAKSRLYGEYDEPELVGEARPLTDPKTNELLGYAYKSKDRSNPLLVSPGHLVSAPDALQVVKSCIWGYRLPEPTRLAHALVNAFRRGESLTEYSRKSV